MRPVGPGADRLRKSYSYDHLDLMNESSSEEEENVAPHGGMYFHISANIGKRPLD